MWTRFARGPPLVVGGVGTLAITSLAVAALIVSGDAAAAARYGLGGNLAGTVMLAIAAFAPARR